MQLLHFQSKDELIVKLEKIKAILLEAINNKRNTSNYEACLKQLTILTNNITNPAVEDRVRTEKNSENVSLDATMDRKQLKQVINLFRLMKITKNIAVFLKKLLAMSKLKPLNIYEKARSSLLEYLDELFKNYLYPPNLNYFHEIFFFDDASIQTHLVGAHRTAIHTALNDPHYYMQVHRIFDEPKIHRIFRFSFRLQCVCCELPNDLAILDTMPDISIVYKLHLEYGKMINLYDWLQAYLSIVDPIADEDESKEVDPELQYVVCLSQMIST